MIRTESRLAATAFVGLVLIVTACAGPAPTGDAADATANTILAGSVDGDPITNEDLIEILSEQQYDLLRSAVKAIATNRLIEKAAKDRSQTTDELFDQEVTSKVALPTDTDVETFYEARKRTPRLNGLTLEEARPQIVRHLTDQATLTRHADFLMELRAAAEIRVLLDPPRLDIEIPLGAPERGDPAAPVTIVEFADFQCPACRKAYPPMQRLLKEYGDQVRFVFRDFPLASHPRSLPASEAAACAADQDRFWDYYQSLMLIKGSLEDADLMARAEALGLDTVIFGACYDGDLFAGEVAAAFEQGRSLGVTSTPTFFVNGRRMVGFPSYEEVREIVEEELLRIRLESEAG